MPGGGGQKKRLLKPRYLVENERDKVVKSGSLELDKFIEYVPDADKELYRNIRDALILELGREARPSDLLMIDMISNDFLSVKRCQRWLLDHPELRIDNGKTLIDEAAKHILKVQKSFRDTMKESLFTRKSNMMRQLEDTDASNWFTQTVSITKTSVKQDTPEDVLGIGAQEIEVVEDKKEDDADRD